MNLIDLLKAAAEKLDNYDDAGSLGMEYQSDKLRAIVAEFPQAIETVRAMQETLDSIRTDCRRGAHELGMTDAGVRDIARRCDEALRRAEGNAG